MNYVFMKAVKPRPPAEWRPVQAADFRPVPLRLHRIKREYRVVVNEAAQDFLRPDRGGGVERHAVIFFYWQPLQAIHMVRHRRRPLAVSRVEVEEVIPRGARRRQPWQQIIVAV